MRTKKEIEQKIVRLQALIDNMPGADALDTPNQRVLRDGLSGLESGISMLEWVLEQSELVDK